MHALLHSIRIALAIALATLLATGPAAAQDNPALPQPADRVVTLSEALTLALGRNIDLAQAANDADLAATNVAANRAAYHPSLSVSVGPRLNYARGSVVDESGVFASDGEFFSGLSVGASGALTVFDAGQRRADLDASQADLAATEASLSRTETETLYLTGAQYLVALQSQDVVRVQEEALTAQREQLEQIEAFYEAGNRPLTDVLQQRATIAQTRQALVAAQRNAATALTDLKQTLRLHPATDLALASVAADVEEVAVILPDEAVVLARDDVEAQRLRVEASEASVRAARAGYYPSVSLSLSAGTSYSSLATQSAFGDQLLDTNPSGSVGLSLTVPILDRRQTQTAVERARLELDNARLELEATQQQAAYDVEQAALDLRATQAQVEAAEAGLAAAAEALEAAEARYRVGAGTFAELADVQRLHTDAAGEVAQARYQLLIDRLTLGYATGDITSALATLR